MDSTQEGQPDMPNFESKFKTKFTGPTSCDDVTEALSGFVRPTSVTHTQSRFIEEDVDFLSHPGCVRNMTYDAMREEVLARGEGKVLEKEQDTMLVDTGKFTGRCPKDRYIVDAGAAHDNVDWGAVNIPMREDVFDSVFDLHLERIQGLEKIYVFDGFVGASKKSRRAVRVVTEQAWHHHFCTNMFIRATPEELVGFKPDLTILNTRATVDNWKELGLRSETAVALDLNRGLSFVTGTEYSGEMKKGAFSAMNYYLPLEGIMSMHSSATVGPEGDTCIFFGLSGTGKTTLSADPTRFLIGDDEHGWDEDGVFNLEGGCYAKMIDLNPEKEPLIHAAIRRDAILENIVITPDGRCDYKDGSRTENTRGSYPMWHIPNHEPTGKAPHATNVIFLACDAFGVLPPVSKLTTKQALYHLVSGYTAKVAGTEQGVTEPTATFSTCFGGAFMPLRPRVYAELFESKIKEHGTTVYLVNTGWTGGAYGVGKRMDIVSTRTIVDRILTGAINDSDFTQPDEFFQLSSPKSLPGVDSRCLDPSQAWDDKEAYRAMCTKLSNMYKDNFAKYAESDAFMADLSNHGPGGGALL
jgi:phosphoenolpyruvate carboxykinase (ATP)